MEEAMLPSKARVLAMLELATIVSMVLLELAAVMMMLMITCRTVVVSTAMAMAQVMRAIGRRGRRTAGDKQRSAVTCIYT
jgi:hypothetical protein